MKLSELFEEQIEKHTSENHYMDGEDAEFAMRTAIDMATPKVAIAFRDWWTLLSDEDHVFYYLSDDRAFEEFLKTYKP